MASFWPQMVTNNQCSHEESTIQVKCDLRSCEANLSSCSPGGFFATALQLKMLQMEQSWAN